MVRDKQPLLPKKRVVISTKGTSSRSRTGDEYILKENIAQRHGGSCHSRQKDSESPFKQKRISDLMTELILNEHEKENMFDLMSLDDIRKKPDLWIAAFDNPIDFIEYCRKRLDQERELLENSRQVEEEILQFVREWTENTEKHANILGDLYKVQDINDKLQEVVMEERTHCQHLVGLNDQLETQRQILSRKYQAALLLGKVDEKSVHHLLEKNPKAVPLTDRLNDLGKKIKECDRKNKLCEVADPTVLSGRVQTLEKHIESLMKQHREEVSVLKEMISQGNLKCESIKAQYTDLLQRNTKSLSELKEVLGATIRENLNLREELLKKDSEFFDLRMKETSGRFRKPNSNRDIVPSNTVFKSQAQESCPVERECHMKLARSEIDLAKKGNLLRETVNKMVMLERKCARLEDENHVLKKATERSLKALKSKNTVLEKRCEKTESRLKLENAGVLHDIRECKTLMKSLIRNVKSYTKEQADMKKKLLQCEGKVNSSVQEPETLERLKSAATTQSNSDVRLHAMNLWVNYLENKVRNIEDEAMSGRNNHQDTNDDIKDSYFNDSPVQKIKDDVRLTHKVSKKSSFFDKMPEMDGAHSMPPNWIKEKKPSSHTSNQYEDDGYGFYDSPTHPSIQ